MVNHWIFKAVTNRFDVVGCLENMEKEDITWMSWNLKDDEKLASEFSVGDKFIIWRATGNDGFEGVIGYGTVIREYAWEKAAEHVFPYHKSSTFEGAGNREFFRIRIQPEQWSITESMVKANWLGHCNPNLSRNKIMPFDQKGTYRITEQVYAEIINLYARWMEGYEVGDNTPPIVESSAINEIVRKPKRVGLKRGSQFRNQVRKAYGGRCAISKENVKEVLTAAHIDPFKNGPIELRGNDDVSNGILLREDLHKLFDKHYIAINPDSMTIVVSPQLKDSDYWKYNGRDAFLPLDGHYYPSKEALQRRLDKLIS